VQVLHIAKVHEPHTQVLDLVGSVMVWPAIRN
jgi:hypothetical protein